MITAIKSWGNSHGIILTQKMLDESHIKTTDNLLVEVSEGKILLKKTNKRKSFEEYAKEYNGKLNFVLDDKWFQPTVEEVW